MKIYVGIWRLSFNVSAYFENVNYKSTFSLDREYFYTFLQILQFRSMLFFSVSNSKKKLKFTLFFKVRRPVAQQTPSLGFRLIFYFILLHTFHLNRVCRFHVKVFFKVYLLAPFFQYFLVCIHSLVFIHRSLSYTNYIVLYSFS